MSFLTALISPVTNLASKLILDKDKYAELQFKRSDNEHEARMSLLATTTTPKIDATVKLLLALRDVVIPLLRPLGSFALAGFAAYCVSENIQLGETVETMMFGAPLAWGASRHVNKQTKAKAKEDWDNE